jgi:hypothetical protein
MDSNVQRVTNKFYQRADQGRIKYGVTTERTDLDLVQWITHLQEELMDATIYLERILKEIKSES